MTLFLRVAFILGNYQILHISIYICKVNNYIVRSYRDVIVISVGPEDKDFKI